MVDRGQREKGCREDGENGRQIDKGKGYREEIE
jgi:hypothetical protein